MAIRSDIITPKELMLKFMYTEAGLHLELLNANLGDWVEQRLKFSRGYEDLSVRAERAFFLLPDRLGEIIMLDFYLRCDRVKTVTIESCDENYLEIGLSGYWLSVAADLAEGIFITQLPDRIEAYLYQLYKTAKDPLVVGQFDCC
jgi:hypothetical protein